MDPHESLGIAIVCLFAPIAVVDGYLLFHRHSRPRMPWYFLFVFSLFRIASGVLLALYPSNQDNVGVIIAAIITLNVGTIPLLMATIGFLRLILAIDFPHDDGLRKRITYSRVGFFVGIFLLIAGGVLIGQYQQPNLVSIGADLGKAAYVIIVFVLLVLVGFELYFLTRRAQLSPAGFTVLCAALAAAPFQIVRIVYSLLGEFTYGQTTWSPLYGPIGPFVGMVIIMEIIAAAIFLNAGYLIPPMGKKGKAAPIDAA